MIVLSILFAVFLTTSVTIGSVFVYYYWYLKKDIIRQYLKKNNVSVKFNPFKKTNYWTCKWEILNKLILKIEHISFLMI